MISLSNLLAVLSLLILSCAGSKTNGEITLQEIFMSGLENLENEKYLQAQSDFKHVVIRGTGSDLGDDAQYYLGEAYYRNEEYLLAVSEYEKLTRRMGFSPFVEDARFKICEAYRIESPKYYHDQEYTEKALERYQEFLDDFPNSSFIDDVVVSIEILREKLGKKIYETGILYMKMEEYESAKMTFQQVSMAKRNNCAMARDIASISREILGANGITEDFPLMRHMANIESVYTYEGTHEMHTLILGQAETGFSAYDS